MTKKIYTAYSSDEFIKYVLYRIVTLAVIIYAITRFSENPVATYIIGGFFLICALFLGNEKVIIYSDKVIQTDNSAWSLIFNSKKALIEIKKIKAISLDSQPPSSFTEDAAVNVLSKVLRLNKTKDNPRTTIYFEMQGGDTIELNSELEKQTIDKVVEVINKLISEKSTAF